MLAAFARQETAKAKPHIAARFILPVHALSNFFFSRQITHFPASPLMLSFCRALSFNQEPVSFPLTAGHYAATTRVSAACQRSPMGVSAVARIRRSLPSVGVTKRVGARST